MELLKKDEAVNTLAIDTIRWKKQRALEAEKEALKGLVASFDRIFAFTQEATMKLRDAELLEVANVIGKTLTTAHSRSSEAAENLADKERRDANLMSPDFEFSATWHNVESALACCGTTPSNPAFEFYFDPLNCGENILVSSSGLKASCLTDTTTGTSVVGTEGFSSGCHRWSMLLEVLPSFQCPCSIHVGVTDEPHLLDSRQAWVWRTAGSKRMKDTLTWKDVKGLSRWDDETVLMMEVQFTEDKRAVLRLWASNSLDHNPFTIEITTASARQKLYPYFYINHRQAIRLLPWACGV